MIAGLLTALAICLPAVLFHLSYLRGMPEVIAAALPNYWMISQFGPALLLTAFTVALAGTLVETASGLVQGFIERVENTRSKPLSGGSKLAVIVALLACGALAGEFGVIALIASGYSAMAVGFLLVYVTPVLFRSMKDWRAGNDNR